MNRLTRYHALAFMVLCMLVAAALRLPNLPEAPPGLHYDEAANGILAADIGLRGDRPVFISSYTGKEVLFFYLAGGIMRLLGDSIFSLRLTAAFVGILTVAATYWLGREMLADRRLAILAAALLAVSFWHVLFSRLGFRAVTQPLLQAVCAAALFRGLRRNDRRWLAVAGLFLGLTAYTYLAARLFPVLLLLGLAPLMINRQSLKIRWSQIGLFMLTAFLALLPLLMYFILNPDAFWVRIGQVAPAAGGSGLTFGQSFLKSLGMLFLEGDPFWRFNLPGRPLFSWITGGLLVLGWIIILWRWRRFPYDWQRAAISLLIFTPLIMILPTALATNEIVPSNLRAIGLIPFIFFLPPVGFVFLFRDIERRIGYPPLTFAVLFAALLILLSGGLATEQAYFQDWAEEPILFYEMDGDLAAIAEYLNGVDTADRTLYVAAAHYRHPTVAFLSEQYEQVKWLPGGDALVYPANGRSLIIFPQNTPAGDWTLPYLNSGRKLDTEQSSEQSPAFTAYEFSNSNPPPILDNAGINFGNTVTLLGYETEQGQSGNELPVTLFWDVVGAPSSNFMPFIQLEDSWGRRWSQEETFSYPSEQWVPGETIIQRASLSVPKGTPPGSYRLRVGLFDPDSGDRLPQLDQNDSYAGDSYFIENIEITAGNDSDALPDPPTAYNKQILPGLTLLGFGRGADSIVSGAPWGFELWWLAEDALPALSLSLKMQGDNGQSYVLLQGQPVHDTYPFSEWQTPQFVIDSQQITIPVEFEPGVYELSLQVHNDEDRVIENIALGSLAVEATDRIFDPPELQYQVDAKFGNEITLLGYNLEQGRSGEYQLELIWLADERPQSDYTVFIHVLDQNGTCCVWQVDQMPLQNQYPTSHWLEGEIVVDAYTIRLPDELMSGDYAVEIGLYKAETGQRLQIDIPGEVGRDALFLRPLSVP